MVWLKYTSSKTWTKRGRILSGNHDCQTKYKIQLNIFNNVVFKYFILPFMNVGKVMHVNFCEIISLVFKRMLFTLGWNVILWSYNFGKVETSFPPLFKTFQEVEIANFKNTRRSFPIKGNKILYPKNFDYNWFLDETQFLGGLAGYKLVKLRSIIGRTRFTALLHIWTRESLTEINQII